MVKVAKAAVHDIKKVIIIDHDICRRCGLCAKACTTSLLQKDNKKDYPHPMEDRVDNVEQIENVFKYHTTACANCRICVITCPREAIYVEATTTVF